MVKSLHTKLVNELGQAIIDGKIATGSVLQAVQLEERYQVSRSVVREAVRVLQSLGLVTSIKRIGIKTLPSEHWSKLDNQVLQWRLKSPQMHLQLQYLNEFRLAIEPTAAFLAAERANRQQADQLLETAFGMAEAQKSGDHYASLELDVAFHTAVLTASGNDMFIQFADMISIALRQRVELDLLPEDPSDDSLQAHVIVAQAIQNGDAVAAQTTMAKIMQANHEELFGDAR